MYIQVTLSTKSSVILVNDLVEVKVIANVIPKNGWYLSYSVSIYKCNDCCNVHTKDEYIK